MAACSEMLPPLSSDPHSAAQRDRTHPSLFRAAQRRYWRDCTVQHSEVRPFLSDRYTADPYP